MSGTVTERGFKTIATKAGAAVTDDGKGWTSTRHPVTGHILQRTPTGYVSVHAGHSWDSAANTINTLTRIWAGS